MQDSCDYRDRYDFDFSYRCRQWWQHLVEVRKSQTFQVWPPISLFTPSVICIITDNRYLSVEWFSEWAKYVISLWWHKHFEERMIQSFILARPSKEKPDSTVMYSGFTLQVSTGQSRWLTSMRGVLSVTLQAFHYKNAWLLHYHRKDGECSYIEADWVEKRQALGQII